MIQSIVSGIDWVNLTGVFIWNFLGSLGAPGGSVLLVSSGALANNYWELFWVILVAIFSSILGDMTAYGLAKRFSLFTSNHLARFKFFRKGETKARELLKGSEFYVVFFTRFALLALCTAVSYLSGFSGINRKKFFAAVVAGEVLYGIIYPFIGFAFKETWNDLTSIITDVVVLVVLIIVIILLLKRVTRETRWKKSQKYTNS